MSLLTKLAKKIQGDFPEYTKLTKERRELTTAYERAFIVEDAVELKDLAEKLAENEMRVETELEILFFKYGIKNIRKGLAEQFDKDGLEGAGEVLCEEMEKYLNLSDEHDREESEREELFEKASKKFGDAAAPHFYRRQLDSEYEKKMSGFRAKLEQEIFFEEVRKEIDENSWIAYR
jgi:hypothetical protein